MKYLLLFIIPLLLAASCENRDEKNEEYFEENCPYDLKYSGHYLKVPITITPHQLTYTVGDTLRISTIFSDSIEDIGTQQTFKIEGFPFKPVTLLYRFYDGLNWDAGYRVNESSVADVYQPFYNFSSNYADGYKANTVYQNGMYEFEMKVILEEAGRYVLVFTDLFQEHLGSGSADLNAEADAITFEGQCTGLLQYYICSMITGETHLELFEDELIYLDEEVYGGGVGTIENSIGPLKTGSLAVEFNGFFGFEVVE